MSVRPEKWEVVFPETHDGAGVSAKQPKVLNMTAGILYAPWLAVQDSGRG